MEESLTRKHRPRRRIAVAAAVACLALAAGSVAAVLRPADASAAVAAKQTQCAKFSGPVLLTYTNPDTIILRIAKGKVYAATTFTMTPSTTYTRNGQPAAFADIRIGDTGTITATESLPSGALLACSVTMTGP